eukprot:8120085-Pyramimonas_sp.AAC.2
MYRHARRVPPCCVNQAERQDLVDTVLMCISVPTSLTLAPGLKVTCTADFSQTRQDGRCLLPILRYLRLDYG